MKLFKPRTKEHTEVRKPGRLWMGLTALTMVLVTAVSLLKPLTPAAQAGRAQHQRVVMYVMDQVQPALPDPGKVHQINYAFALLKDGLATGDHWQGVEEVTAYLRRNPHIDGVLSVGGWGADGFSQACATEDGREKLAESILQLMDKHSFVGVDIDWEYPGSSAGGIASSDQDVENWYALLKLLRKGLDERAVQQGRPYYLSAALGAGEEQLQAVNGKELDKLLDQAVIMAYDLRGFDKQTGHHAALYPQDDLPNTGAHAVKVLAASGLSKEKMLLGLPAYGRMWRQVSGEGVGLNQRAATSGNKTLTYKELTELMDDGYTRYEDAQACAAWWFNGENFVSGESENSLAQKADWLREQGLLGTAIWQSAFDPDGDMLRHVYDCLTNP